MTRSDAGAGAGPGGGGVHGMDVEFLHFIRAWSPPVFGAAAGPLPQPQPQTQPQSQLQSQAQPQPQAQQSPGGAAWGQAPSGRDGLALSSFEQVRGRGGEGRGGEDEGARG